MSITITPEQAAERYGINKGTLANLRNQKKGCPYLKIGRKVLYPVKDFEAWLFSNPVKTMESPEVTK
jgi:hypothetical protein